MAGVAETVPPFVAFMTLVGALLGGCGAAPRVKSTADYRAHALEGKRVAFVPLAVSDGLEDERTGVMLSDRTRAVASTGACRAVAEGWSDGTVVCLDRKEGGHAATLGEIGRLFALDKPIPAEMWQSLRKASNADYALLFRPEGVSSSRQTTDELRGSMTPVFGGGAMLATSALVAAIVAGGTMHYVTVSDTELGYTVSASLVDLRTGKVLKVGVHSDSDSRTVERNLGFAEAPPAAPILEGIMATLGDEVLDD